jgi:hypothetical protein
VLRIGQLLRKEGARLNRRELVRVGAFSALGLSFPALLRAQAAGEAGAPAKSIILLWLWGGPSHLDTFDLKPNAPLEYRGPYAPIATSVPGIQVCELLPRLAKRAHQYSIIRSLNCQSNDHGIAGTIGLTGSDAGALSLGGQTMPGQLKPTHGSVVSKVLGFSPGAPKFMTIGEHLHQGHKPITGEGGGSVGALYDPFRLNYEEDSGVSVPNLQLLDGMTPSGMDHRRALLEQVDSLSRQLENSPGFQRLDEFYQQAFSLLTDPGAREMFNLDAEPEELRRRYGSFRFGQCCLLARRLVESGSRFVQVNWSSHVEPVEDTGDGGWDMHDRYFQQYQDRHAWMLDRALSALLDDLSERGLLEQTVVVAVGEFGRTPKINGKSGRDHWNQCYSGLIAGGGLRSGLVVGQSDARGEYPSEQPVAPADLFATALQQIGIGTTQLTSHGLFPLGEPIEMLT